MILSDAEIRRRLEDGDLDIEPLADPELQIQPASVDLRLGREFLEFERTNIPCIHPDSAEEVEDYVSETIVPEDEDFVVHPGDFVLGTTVERVDIPPDLIAHVEGRSSLGRLAVVVHASLPGDESVFLWTPSEGFGFYDIGEIVERERPARAVAFDPRTLRVSTHRVTDHITNPRKRIYRVELDSGRAAHVTRDHNLFTLDERGGVTRIPSEDAVGEHVMVPARLPGSPTPRERIDVLDLLNSGETTLYASDGSGSLDRSTGLSGSRDDHQSQPATVDRTGAGDIEVTLDRNGTRRPRELRLTPEFGWMLGFSITAGSTHRGQLRVTSTDTASLDRFAAVLGTHDVDTARHEDGRSTTLRVRSERWSALIGTGEEPTVPEMVFDWPETVQEAVLEGMLDGEGHNQTRDRLSTANPELADRAAYLGTRLGLLTAVHSTERTANGPTGGDYEMWVVEFSEDGRGHSKLPVPGALLRTLRERAGMELSDAADAADLPETADTTGPTPSSILDVERERSTVEWETLDRFREAYAGAGVDTTRLDQLLDGDVRFEEVVDVVETDRVEPTYDLEVQPGGQPIENFLAGRGGIFLSNTAGLCDPGYRGQITLELSNLGAAPVALSPGMRVSQLTFTELTSPAERPYGQDRGSKYQEQEGPQASRIGGDREFGGEQ
jgi:deoxycytidine triphosphate deaminase/transcriptional regulator with XRE-family HTH domain